MADKPVILPAQLTACVNEFLSQANEMQKKHPSNAVSASLLYAAARFNVHGYAQEVGGRRVTREVFLGYMTDLYRRMLEEQVDVLGQAQEAAP